jgi:hypothetical protein
MLDATHERPAPAAFSSALQPIALDDCLKQHGLPTRRIAVLSEALAGGVRPRTSCCDSRPSSRTAVGA